MSRFWVAVALVILVAVPVSAVPRPEDEAATAKAAVARLTQEKAALKAELAKQQQRIDELVKLLKDNGISAPDDGAVPAASGGLTIVVKGAPSPSKGPWLVHVISNEPVASADLERDVLTARDEVSDLDAQLEQANRTFHQLDNEWVYDYDNRGNRSGKHHRSEAGFQKAKTDVSRLEADRKRAAAALARAERGLKEGSKARLVVAQTPDAQTVDIQPMNEAAGQILRGFEPGQWYEVTGPGTTENGALKIKMSAAIRHPGPAAGK
jgi:hypothetical protein